ncbi:hypothetical protein GLYMA_02G312401v4 [Glycine max]|nr:hypothetical protein GLYMA_02G312401v4 [Glycine max]
MSSLMLRQVTFLKYFVDCLFHLSVRSLRLTSLGKTWTVRWSSHDYRLNLGYAVLLFQCLKMFIWGIEDLYPLAVILTFSLSAYFLSISISISNGVLTYNYIIFSPLVLLYNFIIWFSCLFSILSRVPSTKLLKLKG